MKQMGINDFRVIRPSFSEENYKYDLPITKKVVEFAFLKANSVLKEIKNRNYIIVSGDTEVFRSGRVFSKTSSRKEVGAYLKSLSGRKHFVYGGLCVMNTKGKISKRLVKTEVYFNRISCKELEDKTLINEGIGKSGGYAIQGLAGKFVKKIRGSYSNVVGLSISDLYSILKGFGFKNWNFCQPIVITNLEI